MMKLLCLAMALGSVSATDNGSRQLQAAGCSPADLDGNGYVGVNDLLVLLARYGDPTDAPVDFDGDGTVAVNDLLFLLSEYGQESDCSQVTDRGEFFMHACRASHLLPPPILPAAHPCTISAAAPAFRLRG